MMPHFPRQPSRFAARTTRAAEALADAAAQWRRGRAGRFALKDACVCVCNASAPGLVRRPVCNHAAERSPRQARSSASHQRLLGGSRLGRRGRRLGRRCRRRLRGRGRPLLARVRRVQLGPQACHVSARRVQLRLQRRLLRLHRAAGAAARERRGATPRQSRREAPPRGAAAATHAPGAHTCPPAAAAKRLILLNCCPTRTTCCWTP